jgi:hypothetical protein
MPSLNPQKRAYTMQIVDWGIWEIKRTFGVHEEHQQTSQRGGETGINHLYLETREKLVEK